MNGLSIDGVFNPHRESAEQFANKHKLDFATDDEEEFYSKINAVDIASPHATHYPYAKRALEHGLHVLCEKPLALTRVQAEELYELAGQKHLVLMEAVKTAHIPGFSRLLSTVKSGIIGEVVDVEGAFTRLTDSSKRELTDPVGGSFTEFGSYPLLPIFKILGRDYLDVQFKMFLDENGLDIYAKAEFKYPHALATAKTGLKVKSEGQLLISGTKGYILVPSPWWLTDSFQICYEDFRQNETISTKFLGTGLRYELSDFVSTINGIGNSDFKLTRGESIAMAEVVEKFLKARKELQERV